MFACSTKLRSMGNHPVRNQSPYLIMKLPEVTAIFLPLKSLSNWDDMSTCNGLLHGIVRALADSTLPWKDPSVRTLQTGRRRVPLCINH